MQRRLYIDEANTALDIFRFAVFLDFSFNYFGQLEYGGSTNFLLNPVFLKDIIFHFGLEMPISAKESSGSNHSVKMSLRCYLRVVIRISLLYLDDPVLVYVVLVNLMLLPGLPDGLGPLLCQ